MFHVKHSERIDNNMTIDEHNKLIQQMMDNVGDQAVISDCLSKLRTDYADTTKTLTETQSQKTLLEKNMEDLRIVNNSLMRQGAKLVETQQLHDEEDKNNPGSEDENTLEYENLFNEKGELI